MKRGRRKRIKRHFDSFVPASMPVQRPKPGVIAKFLRRLEKTFLPVHAKERAERDKPALPAECSKLAHADLCFEQAVDHAAKEADVIVECNDFLGSEVWKEYREGYCRDHNLKGFKQRIKAKYPAAQTIGIQYHPNGRSVIEIHYITADCLAETGFSPQHASSVH